MKDTIRFCKADMDSAAKTIDEKADAVKALGDKFVEDMNTAISSWEGPSKDKFAQLIDNDVKTHLTVDIPKLIKGLAIMIRENYSQMNNADMEVAGELPTNLISK